MCYSVINPCGYWTSGTLSALVSNQNTVYNVMGVKRHIMPVDLPQSVSISGAEINLTFWAVSTCVLCCNLAESKSVLKMCFSKHCHEVTGFLLWIRTYCISCVVQQRSTIKDLFSLVGYDDSCLAAIRHVKYHTRNTTTTKYTLPQRLVMPTFLATLLLTCCIWAPQLNCLSMNTPNYLIWSLCCIQHFEYLCQLVF